MFSRARLSIGQPLARLGMMLPTSSAQRRSWSLHCTDDGRLAANT
jgi:hypothetical protein